MVIKLIKWCFQHLLNRFWVLQTYSSQCFFISTFRIRPCSMWELDETLWICLIGAASWFSTQLLSLPWYTHAEVSETHQCNRVINHFCCGFPQQWFEVWSFTSTCWHNNVTVSSLNVDVREQYWNSYFKNAVSSDLRNWESVAIRWCYQGRNDSSSNSNNYITKKPEDKFFALMLCLMHSSVVFSRHHVNLSILPTIVPKKDLHLKKSLHSS